MWGGRGYDFVIYLFDTLLPVIYIIYIAVELIPSGNHNFLDVWIFVGIVRLQTSTT